MNILYVAYSCAPNKGSEDKIGWNIPLESAKTNRVCILTREEQRGVIEAYLKENHITNIKFYYVDIPHIYKKFFKGVACSLKLNILHRRAISFAKKICEIENIEIIHQITPIEFRSVGNYGKIPNIKFVCGPLGGGESMPKGLRPYAKGHMLVEWIRSALNFFAYKKYQFSKKLNQCDYILFANNETKNFLTPLVSNTKTTVFFDNGIEESSFYNKSQADISHAKVPVFLVAGRMAYRKGHKFLLEALSQLPKNMEYECRIIGGGPELERLKSKSEQLGLQQNVVFTGKIPFSEMRKEYEEADVFIMPSIRETTGAVLLEAMSSELPVITINKFGGPILLDHNSAWLYDGNTKEEYVDNLKQAIVECISNPEEVSRRGKNAKQYATQHLWSKKIDFYNRIYLDLRNKE